MSLSFRAKRRDAKHLEVESRNPEKNKIPPLAALGRNDNMGRNGVSSETNEDTFMSFRAEQTKATILSFRAE